MMTKLTSLIWILTLMTTLNSRNPVKFSMSLLLLSAILFLNFYLFSGTCWYPMLFFLIFMGGILMMFMVLSSILPNEKSGKMKIYTMMLIAMLTTTSALPNNNFNKLNFATKSMLNSNNSMIWILSILILYFFYSISMSLSENLPMRTMMCRKTLIL